MAVLGADPVELRSVAKQMRASQMSISDATKRLGGRVRSSGWKGTDADAFISRWKTHESKLASAASLLQSAAASLEKHAVEQADASAAGACPVAPADLGLGASSASPLLAATPSRTETFWVNAEFAALFGLDGEARVSIEHLHDGSAIVWLEGTNGLAVEVGSGFHAGPDNAGIGLRASAFARASESARFGWRMDGEDVDNFIARTVASHAVDRGTGDAFIPDDFEAGDLPLIGGLLPGFLAEANLERTMNPLGKGLSDWFDSSDIDVGDPHYFEHAVGLDAGGDLDADLGLALAGLGVGGGLFAGVLSSPDGLSLQVRGIGTAEAKVAGRGFEGTVDRTVEISLDDRGSTEVTVTTTTRHGDAQTLTTETYEVTRANGTSS